MFRIFKIEQFFSPQAFTLMELMIAALILALVLVGLLASYLTCMQLAEIAQNTTLAMNAIRTKAEQIEGYPFDNIKADYDGVTFIPPTLNGIGVSYIDDNNPDLLVVTITVCWRQSKGRIIGEDLDLDGQLDAGEDSNMNGILDSPAQIVTYIARK